MSIRFPPSKVKAASALQRKAWQLCSGIRKPAQHTGSRRYCRGEYDRLNGKNYILRYVLLPCLLLALLVCLFLTLFVYRRRHPNLRLKKPWKKAGTEKSQYKKDEDDML